MHDRMMRTGKRFAVYLAAAVIITCCLAQTIDCYRLRKKERQEGRKGSDSTKVTDVEEGRIVFGRVFKKATGLDAPVIDDTKKPSNASSEDEASYQADFPGKLDCATKQILKVLTLLFLDLKKKKTPFHSGWSGDQLQHLNSREAAWKRMSPSLMCGGDQLKFSADGRGASQFAVDKGKVVIPICYLYTCFPLMQSHMETLFPQEMNPQSLCPKSLHRVATACRRTPSGSSCWFPMMAATLLLRCLMFSGWGVQIEMYLVCVAGDDCL